MKKSLVLFIILSMLLTLDGCLASKVVDKPVNTDTVQPVAEETPTDSGISLPINYAITSSNVALPEQYNIKNTATLTMTFTQEMVVSTLTSNNIYITDKTGTKFPTTLTVKSGKEFSLTPTKSYSYGEKYTLYVLTKNIKIKATNTYSSYNIYMNFTIAAAPDTTPPVFSTDTPKISVTLSQGFSAQIKINENGKLYYVVIPNNVSAPISAQVKLGLSSSGNALKSGNISLVKDTVSEISVSGLLSSTDYDVYFVAEDSYGNIQPSPKKLDVKTGVATTTVTTASTVTTKTAVTTSTPIVPVSTSNSFTYNGISYSGKGKTNDASTAKVVNDTGINITEPSVKKFDTDAFFTLKGTISYTGADKYSLVTIMKNSTGEISNYWITGNFEKRIWLSFGAGVYRVTVNKIKVVSNNLNYDGDINSWMDYGAVYSFEVNNTRNEDGKFYYPSDAIQSDDTAISSKASSLTSGLTKQADKIKAIHDFVVSYLYYDNASLVTGQRKKQDALASLNNKTAVCEGYTSLLNALLRSIGIKAKCIAGYGGGGAHAWSNVYKDNVWYFLDSTWDDPKPNDKNPSSIYYTYYMLTSFTGINGDHSPTSDRPSRALVEENLSHTSWNGYPNGIY